VSARFRLQTEIMIRRYVYAPVRGLVLAALALAGFAYVLLVVVGMFLLGLVPFYPAAVRFARRLADAARRAGRAWGGVPIARPYLAPPAPPRPRSDGWYQHDRQLYKSPRPAAYIQTMAWMGHDPATMRDWAWLLLTPWVGGAAAALPAALIAAGGVEAALDNRVIGVALVLCGLALGPTALRLYALWSRVLLQPAAESWWHRSGLAGWVGRRRRAVVHNLALLGLSLAMIPLLDVHWFALLLSGGLLLPQVSALARPVLDLYRRLAGARLGVVIPTPYRPAPPPPRPGPDGLYRQGRNLHAKLEDAQRWQRREWVLTDPATWRDMLWMLTAPFAAVPLLIPTGAVGLGLLGLLLQPVWWPLWALPAYAVRGVWVTPWFVWDALTAGLPWLDPVPGWLSPLVGLALAVIGALLAGPLLWLNARWARYLLGPTRAARLAQRVEDLTETRAEALDAQAAELRRIERDLHDGAQARLIAVGLSLDAVDRLLDTDPTMARQLLAQARETSASALSELRHLVRGIHPPVLSERGLADAVRAVALDSPLRVDVTVDLEGRPEAAVESAAYFAVCEALANATRHSGASRVEIDLRHAADVLRVTVTDDGRGGADPRRGSGLQGVRRRLATFDGDLTVHSPLGGPTVVTMEIPCVLSWPRTSTF
jgi:signal transduction histidine kinase